MRLLNIWVCLIVLAISVLVYGVSQDTRANHQKTAATLWTRTCTVTPDFKAENLKTVCGDYNWTTTPTDEAMAVIPGAAKIECTAYKPKWSPQFVNCKRTT